MIVCHCKGITDRDLRRMGAEEARAGQNPAQILAGSACGGCRPLVLALLSEAKAAKPTQGGEQTPRR